MLSRTMTNPEVMIRMTIETPPRAFAETLSGAMQPMKRKRAEALSDMPTLMRKKVKNLPADM